MSRGGGGRSYERQSESPKRLDRNQKSFSLEHLRRYPKIGIFLQNNRFISSRGLSGEGIIPDSFAKGFNALRPLNYGAGGMAASDVTWC